MPAKKGDRLLSRRGAFATMAGGVSLVAAPAIVAAQTPLKVSFVQQRGLLYLPVDMMVTGGVLQQEATRLGLGKVEATAKTLSYCPKTSGIKQQKPFYLPMSVRFSATMATRSASTAPKATAAPPKTARVIPGCCRTGWVGIWA